MAAPNDSSLKAMTAKQDRYGLYQDHADSYVRNAKTLHKHFEERQCSFTATVYGGSRAHPQIGKEVEKIAAYLASEGAMVKTGGGGGYMLAGNHGAANGIKQHGRGASVGILLNGLSEVVAEDEWDKKDLTLSFTALTLWERKELLMDSTDVVVYAPGGLGTMDELFAFECLLKLDRPEVAINDDCIRIFVGKDFWDDIVTTFFDKFTGKASGGRLSFIKDEVDGKGRVSHATVKLNLGFWKQSAAVSKSKRAAKNMQEWHFCDSAEEAIAVITAQRKRRTTKNEQGSINLVPPIKEDEIKKMWRMSQ